MLLDLSTRNLQPEWMDSSGLNADLHRQALSGLQRLNRVSGSSRILWRGIRKLADSRSPHPLRVLDIASGGGDVTIGIWQRAQRAGVPLEIVGYDVSGTAVEFAQRSAVAAAAEVRFEMRDALAGPLPGGFDVVVCSLFLHHLSEEQAIKLMRTMAAAAARLVLVNDLLRSWDSYLLVQAACRVLSRCPVVHVDGPRSVAGAFTLCEVAELAKRAGIQDASISRRWPCRYLLSWSPPLGHSTKSQELP